MTPQIIDTPGHDDDIRHVLDSLEHLEGIEPTKDRVIVIGAGHPNAAALAEKLRGSGLEVLVEAAEATNEAMRVLREASKIAAFEISMLAKMPEITRYFPDKPNKRQKRLHERRGATHYR